MVRVWKRIAVVVLGLAATTACRRGARVESTQETPPFTREGTRILVPAQSPLRAKLQVEPVRRLPVSSRLSAPASLEADPSRMAKITPPLAGRVTSLSVKLGSLV